MFQDLDDTLAALVEAEMPLSGITVSFATPDDQFPPSGVTLPAVAFFLYDVRENHELRTNQWDNTRQDSGMVTRKRAPARVLCSYLVTAWPNESAPNPAQDEHRLLGAVMKVLLRHREIPASYLRGELAEQPAPLPARITAESQLQGIGEFWQAMGGRPKAILHYSVTLSVDVFESTDVGPEVTETVVRVGHGVDHES
jgi:Pvc16 N-terminal domain